MVSHNQRDEGWGMTMCAVSVKRTPPPHQNLHTRLFGSDIIEEDFYGFHDSVWNIKSEGQGMNHRTTDETTDLAKRYTA